MLFVGIIVFYLLSKSTMILLKYLSPQLISDPIHTSTIGVAIQYGKYSCFTIGDIDAWAWKFRGREGTIVVPTACVSARGRNVDIPTPLELVKPSELPYSERPKILRDKRLRSPYWRGYLPRRILIKHPKANYIIEENKGLSETNAFITQELKMKFKTVEDIMQSKSRIAKLKDTILSSKKKEEEY